MDTTSRISRPCTGPRHTCTQSPQCYSATVIIIINAKVVLVAALANAGHCTATRVRLRVFAASTLAAHLAQREGRVQLLRAHKQLGLVWVVAVAVAVTPDPVTAADWDDHHVVTARVPSVAVGLPHTKPRHGNTSTSTSTIGCC